MLYISFRIFSSRAEIITRTSLGTTLLLLWIVRTSWEHEEYNGKVYIILCFYVVRYRFAAVPTRFRKAEDPRLRPRASQKLFHNTILLAKDNLKFQTVLNVWFGNDQQEWQLLYRASKDGFSAAAFHTKCDGHSPTFTVILVSTGLTQDDVHITTERLSATTR